MFLFKFQRSYPIWLVTETHGKGKISVLEKTLWLRSFLIPTIFGKVIESPERNICRSRINVRKLEFFRWSSQASLITRLNYREIYLAVTFPRCMAFLLFVSSPFGCRPPYIFCNSPCYYFIIQASFDDNSGSGPYGFPKLFLLLRTTGLFNSIGLCRQEIHGTYKNFS